MIRIAIDLELERPKREQADSSLYEEQIIQVGWIVFESNPFTIIKEQCHHVNIGLPLSAYIKTLTRITDEDIASGMTLEAIYDLLKSDLKEFNASRIAVQWGSGDLECLKKELDNVNDWPFGRSGLNVKHLYQVYAEANAFNMSGGLSKCMGRLGLKWLGQGKHNAMNDARNTAIIYAFLMNKMKSNDKKNMENI